MKNGAEVSHPVPRAFSLKRPLHFMEYSLPYNPSPKDGCRDLQLEYYNKHVGKCCSRCPPGYYLFRECTNTSNSDCKQCGPNAYTAFWNYIKQCHQCEVPCSKAAGLIETQACNASHNRICSCPSNKFCRHKLSANCEYCANRTICAKGSGASVTASDNSNTKCSPCPPGTFSDEESHSAACKPHRNCSRVSEPGSSTRDATCADSGLGLIPTPTFADSGLGLILIPTPRSVAEVSLGERNGPQTSTETWTVSPAKVVSKNATLHIGVILGGVLVGLVALALIFTIFAHAKSRLCFPHAVEEAMQLNAAGGNQSDRMQQDPFVLSYKSPKQEQEHLLDTEGSSSCSLEFPLGSEVKGGIAHNCREQPARPRRSGGTTCEGGTHHHGLRPDSLSAAEPPGNRCAQVNVTCIVNVCKPEHASWTTSSAAEGHPTCTAMNDNLPLSKEEDSLPFEPEPRISFIREGASLYPKLETLPLSVEDTEMKIR